MQNQSILNHDNVLRLEKPRPASREDLLRVHEAGYVDRVAGTAGRPYAMLDPDTHTSERSYEAALYAAGAVVGAVDAVRGGAARNGFALVRPPGHHAEAARAMGFCLFNNVAVGARYLLDVAGMERVLVVDWDVHHGNGTQRAFYDDDRVLFVSTHQYPCYPGTGSVAETGEGAGEGYTVNIPLPPGCGDAEYGEAFRRIVRPVALAFRPQFVLVSAGFDAHRDDPLAGMSVTGAGYRYMASVVREIADASAGGRMVCVLEGGYNLEALVSSVEAVVDELAGPPGGSPGAVADPAGAGAVLDPAIRSVSRYWEL